MNIAAVLSLAGIGFDRTRLKVVADPALVYNTHYIDIRGRTGNISDQAGERARTGESQDRVARLLQRAGSAEGGKVGGSVRHLGKLGTRGLRPPGTPDSRANLAKVGAVTPRTQKETLAVWGALGLTRSGRATTGRGCRGNRNAMADDDGVVSYQDFFDDETHDSLALHDIKRVGGAAQSGEERRERLGQAQERSAILRLICDRLQLGAQRLFTLA